VQVLVRDAQRFGDERAIGGAHATEVQVHTVRRAADRTLGQHATRLRVEDLRRCARGGRAGLINLRLTE
jgi:hypothetical protein